MRIPISVLAAALVAAAARLAHAGGPIAIEVHEGDRAADAATLLEPVYDALVRRGFRAGDALVAEVERTISRSPGQLSASELTRAQKAVDDAYRGLIEGEYPDAAAAGQKALDLYASAPGHMAREAPLRDLQFKAFVIVARSHEAAGHGEQAFATMAEAIRTFPDRHVSTAEFDPRVNALFRRVKAELTKQGVGSLEIKVDDPAAAIFVNERYQTLGPGGGRVDSLFPGTYRVYLANAGRTGRVHTVRVNPGETATLSLSWQLDGTLRTGAGYVGIELPPGAGKPAIIAAAARVARELGAATVVILGIQDVDGRRSVTGYAVNTESQSRVFGAVQVEPIEPTPDVLAKLGAFLGGDKAVDTAGILTREPRPSSAAGTSAGSSGPRFGVVKWIVTGVGAAAVAGGITMIALDEAGEDRSERQARYFQGTWPGIGVAAGGAALVGLGVYMFIADRGAADETPSVSIMPTRDGVTVGVAGRF